MVNVSFCICLILMSFIVTGSAGSEVCSAFTTISTTGWGSRFPNAKGEHFPSIPKMVIVTQTDNAPCNTVIACKKLLRDFEDYLTTVMGYPMINHNFFIGNESTVYMGRGWKTVGQSTYIFNKKSISVAFLGTYWEYNPNPKSIVTLKNLLKCGVEEGFLDPKYKLYVIESIECSANFAPAIQEDMLYIKEYAGNVAGYMNCAAVRELIEKKNKKNELLFP